MTENLAGRGEGLAGLRELDSISDLLHEHAVGLRSTNALRGISIGDLASRLDRAQVKLEMALEAAAPAGAADEREHDLEIMLRYALEGRCAVCGWPIAKSANEGCVQGNCSMRPQDSPFRNTWLRRAKLAAALATPSPQAPELPRKCFNCEQQEGLQDVPLCKECFTELEDVR